MKDKIEKYIGILGSIVAILGLVLAVSQKIDFKRLDYIIVGIISLGVGLLTSFLIKLTKDKKRVFMIYSHKDKVKATEIYNQLKDNNVDVRFDEDVIKFGDNINEKLQENINKADKLIIVFSGNTNSSQWVNKEIETAKFKDKDIFPVLIEDTEIPDDFKNIKYANMAGDNKIDFEKLSKTLNE